MPKVRYVVDSECVGMRVDVVLVSATEGLTRSQAGKLFDASLVTINGKVVKPRYKVDEGDILEFDQPEPVPSMALPEDIPLDIVYEDQHMAVINKPRGMVTHPAPGSWNGTLVNAILGHYGQVSSVGLPLRPGIVHRLDKDTTGLIMVARSDEAHYKLVEMIAERSVERRYLALVWGCPSWQHAMVDAALGRDQGDPTKMAVRPEMPRSKDAVTELYLKQSWGICSLLEAKLHTGRTHQVRVHCTYARHSVVGDAVYGNDDRIHTMPLVVRKAMLGLQGQALHAWSLSLKHPITNEAIHFEAPPPSDFKQVMDALDSYYANP